MGDPPRDSTANSLRRSTSRTARVTVLAVALGVLWVASTLGGPGAVTTVGLVLGEAIALYVGYGALARLATPILHEALGSD